MKLLQVELWMVKKCFVPICMMTQDTWLVTAVIGRKEGQDQDQV